mgnify:CR=1 FL=1
MLMNAFYFEHGYMQTCNLIQSIDKCDYSDYGLSIKNHLTRHMLINYDLLKAPRINMLNAYSYTCIFYMWRRRYDSYFDKQIFQSSWLRAHSFDKKLDSSNFWSISISSAMLISNYSLNIVDEEAFTKFFGKQVVFVFVINSISPLYKP